MATAIKAIPTLHGKEAKEFLRHAEEAERNFKGFKNIEEHPFCVMARSILEKPSSLESPFTYILLLFYCLDSLPTFFQNPS